MEEFELLEPFPDVASLFCYYNHLYFEGKLGATNVQWSSNRMTMCAGTCEYRGGGCIIKLSEPLLKFRPVKDLKETLLHEMIHAYLFLEGIRDRGNHGPRFQERMHLINSGAVQDHQRPAGGYNVTIYHTMHNEVDNYRTHWWQCQRCQNVVKRAMNRPPQEADCRGCQGRGPACSDNKCLYHMHVKHCGGTYIKIRSPNSSKADGGSSGSSGGGGKAGRSGSSHAPASGAASSQKRPRTGQAGTAKPAAGQAPITYYFHASPAGADQAPSSLPSEQRSTAVPVAAAQQHLQADQAAADAADAAGSDMSQHLKRRCLEAALQRLDAAASGSGSGRTGAAQGSSGGLPQGGAAAAAGAVQMGGSSSSVATVHSSSHQDELQPQPAEQPAIVRAPHMAHHQAETMPSAQPSQQQDIVCIDLVDSQQDMPLGGSGIEGDTSGPQSWPAHGAQPALPSRVLHAPAVATAAYLPSVQGTLTQPQQTRGMPVQWSASDGTRMQEAIDGGIISNTIVERNVGQFNQGVGRSNGGAADQDAGSSHASSRPPFLTCPVCCFQWAPGSVTNEELNRHLDACLALLA